MLGRRTDMVGRWAVKNDGLEGDEGLEGVEGHFEKEASAKEPALETRESSGWYRGGEGEQSVVDVASEQMDGRGLKGKKSGEKNLAGDDHRFFVGVGVA